MSKAQVHDYTPNPGEIIKDIAEQNSASMVEMEAGEIVANRQVPYWQMMLDAALDPERFGKLVKAARAVGCDLNLTISMSNEQASHVISLYASPPEQDDLPLTRQ